MSKWNVKMEYRYTSGRSGPKESFVLKVKGSGGEYTSTSPDMSHLSQIYPLGTIHQEGRHFGDCGDSRIPLPPDLSIARACHARARMRVRAREPEILQDDLLEQLTQALRGDSPDNQRQGDESNDQQ